MTAITDYINPLFNSYMKLYICDINFLKKGEELEHGIEGINIQLI